ncbi:mandelate racemase/muconate lactonizing enzyme family protein [Microbacterium sp. AK031]|uniref:mandelate racemase/muconate lactonizing enzyme family protein n=1 Tax=Microbacterium sp. AK031 TaxID=2723076 RepID=UPI0021686C9C|nr:mandelate racemase/muconate lactonizing enzyme family protein [Microbacterium sp. AK031]MCS3844594.1 L-alanine-DL-glutamate epimerase-like enolase superfamily enzyme [Microbacterium sp. AK031]
MTGTRIRDIRFFRATSATSRPVSDATHDISEIAFYVMELETEAGVIGQGYLLAFHYSPQAICGALHDLRRFILDREYDVHQTRDVQNDYERESEYFGISGLQRWALAIANVTMWDAWARHLGQPIWKVLGSHSRKVPVYGSGGWLSYSDDELIDEVLDYKGRGFTAVKIKVGSPEIERDVERLRRVREAVGSGLKIMMDANQGMDVPSAIALIHRAADLDIHWFEEPIPRDDFDGYAAIHSKTRISLAMGEREYDTVALRELLRRGAIDLWQPDIIRLGGVDAWRDSAALAAAHRIPVLPHYYKDYDVPLLATVSNGFGAESFDWIDAIVDAPMPIKGGFATPRTGDGWGFRFLPEFLHEVAEIPVVSKSIGASAVGTSA